MIRLRLPAAALLAILTSLLLLTACKDRNEPPKPTVASAPGAVVPAR